MNKKLQKKYDSESKQVLDSIRRIVRSVRNFSKFTEKELGLSTAQIYVLQKLKESGKPLSVNELAEATLTHQSSVSVVVSKLVNRNFVERNADASDSRSVRLVLSKQGEYLLSKSPESMQQRLMNGLARMSVQERNGLVSGLKSLIQNAGLQDEEASMLMEDGGN